jgi:hypothetical protein
MTSGAKAYGWYGGGPAVGAPNGAWNAPFRTVTGQPYLAWYASATRASVASSVTGAAVPSTMKSISSVETVTAKREFAARFLAFRAPRLVVE